MTRLISSVGTRIVVERFAQLLAPERWIYAFLRNKAIYPPQPAGSRRVDLSGSKRFKSRIKSRNFPEWPTNEIGVKTIDRYRYLKLGTSY